MGLGVATKSRGSEKEGCTVVTVSDKRRLEISRRLDALILGEDGDTEFRKNCITVKRSLFAAEITQDHADAGVSVATELVRRGAASTSDVFLFKEIRDSISRRGAFK